MKITRITSRSNERIKHLRKLAADRDYRYLTGEYVIEGIRLLDDLADPLAVFVREGTVPPALPGAAPVYELPAEVFASVSTTEHSQGVIVVGRLKLFGADGLSRSASYVLLDRLQDPGNAGSIIRSACAFGFRGIIVTPGCVDPFSPKVVRAAASSLGKIDVVQIEDVRRLEGFPVIGSDMRGIDVSSFTWPEHVIIAVGSEAAGLSDDVRRLSRSIVAVPSRGPVESLNAAVAAGILLYCASRR